MSPDEDDDMKWNESIPMLWKIIVFLFDGIVILLALIMVIIGLIGFFQLKKEENCPLIKVGENCNTISTVFLFVNFIGLGMFATAILIILGIVLSLKFLLRVSNIVFIALCFVLLILTIMVGLATGALASSVTEFDEHYIRMRNDIRKVSDRIEFRTFCAEECIRAEDATEEEFLASCSNEPIDGYQDLDADACKADIQEKVEEYMTTVGISVLVICSFMIAILIFTQLAIGIWKSNEENDEIGDVGTDE